MCIAALWTQLGSVCVVVTLTNAGDQCVTVTSIDAGARLLSLPSLVWRPRLTASHQHEVRAHWTNGTLLYLPAISQQDLHTIIVYMSHTHSVTWTSTSRSLLCPYQPEQQRFWIQINSTTQYFHHHICYIIRISAKWSTWRWRHWSVWKWLKFAQMFKSCASLRFSNNISQHTSTFPQEGSSSWWEWVDHGWTWRYLVLFVTNWPRAAQPSSSPAPAAQWSVSPTPRHVARGTCPAPVSSISTSERWFSHNGDCPPAVSIN